MKSATYITYNIFESVLDETENGFAFNCQISMGDADSAH